MLKSHSVKETAKILGVTPMWVYKLKERFRLSNGDISACIKSVGLNSACLPELQSIHKI
nr:helix-turn-helix domain-containing protein [Fervidicola ferrireducens]